MTPAADALLVVVDMQRVFAEPDSPWCVPDFATLEQPIASLLGKFGERAVFTRFMVPAVPAGGWREYYREWSFMLEPGAERLLELAAPWSEVQRPVIDKPTFSSYGPELQAVARRLQASTLVLCGVSTECCVLATALAAADDGVSVRIVRDACASVDRASHQAALHVAVAGFAPLITLATVQEEIALRE
jgi:nicotinamidase-related amidase